jgi:hypothetical protein
MRYSYSIGEGLENTYPLFNNSKQKIGIQGENRRGRGSEKEIKR